MRVVGAGGGCRLRPSATAAARRWRMTTTATPATTTEASSQAQSEAQPSPPAAPLFPNHPVRAFSSASATGETAGRGGDIAEDAGAASRRRGTGEEVGEVLREVLAELHSAGKYCVDSGAGGVADISGEAGRGQPAVATCRTSPVLRCGSWRWSRGS